MSLSPKSLSSIQKLGQAAHDATVVIAAAVRTQAESMVANMAIAPFGAESEQSISRFKTLSNLSQGLATIEAQLQELYAAALELANPASDVIIVRAVSRRQAVANATAVDGVAKPAKAANKAKKGGSKAVTLTANDKLLLAFLQRSLKSGKTMSITGNEMSDGSGLPLGSVALSLQKILTVGAVDKVGRGTYQLGVSAAAVADAVAKSAAAKKAKPALAKKAKAAKVEAPMATEVRAMPAKRAQAAPANKTKAPLAKKLKAMAPAAEAAAAPV